jgi:hypothetical protein
MSDSAIGAMLIAGELLVLAVAALGVIAYRALTQRRRARSAASEFAQRWKSALPQRRDTMRRSLVDSAGCDETQAAEHASTLLEHERSVFRSAIDLLLRRDPRGLSRLGEDVTQLTAAYQELASARSDGASAAEPASENADAEPNVSEDRRRLQRENDRLVAENARLKADVEAMEQQVVQSKREVESVLKEYASMYEGSREGGERKVDEQKKKVRQRSGAPAGNEPAAPESE